MRTRRPRILSEVKRYGRKMDDGRRKGLIEQGQTVVEERRG
jgi:hypothetical protein